MFALALFIGSYIVFGLPAMVATYIANLAINNPYRTARMVMGAAAGFLLAYLFDIPYEIDITFGGAVLSFILGEIFEL